jgi:hypothetical protein
MAVLAASSRDALDSVAAAMVHLDRTIEPRGSLKRPHEEGYLRLLDLLVQRRWLPDVVAAHARERAAQ